MNRIMSAGLSLVVAASCFLTGCGGQEVAEQPYNIAFVTVIANNNPVLDTEIEELAQLSEIAGTTYSCILADSTPSVICSGTVPDFSGKGYSEDMIKRAKASVAADIIAQLDAAEPDSDEVDIAAATALAVRKLRSEEAEGQDNILVYYGSGVSTSGLIDMTAVPVCDLDIETSAADLAETMNLDLTGIRIVFYCCGDVAGTEQNSLSENEKKILKEFYSAWLTNMGAEDVIFMDAVPPDGSYSFNCQVSVMETEGTQSVLTAKVIDFEEVKESEIEEVFEEGTILSFGETSIAFLPDSTELANSESAMEALSYVISYMEVHPEFTLLICGTTTSAGNEESCIVFSEQRAKAVRNLLVEKAGIDEDRIVTLGCGYSSCLYVNDKDIDGSLNENASQNRSVKLIDYNSEIASEIIRSLETE